MIKLEINNNFLALIKFDDKTGNEKQQFFRIDYVRW